MIMLPEETRSFGIEPTRQVIKLHLAKESTDGEITDINDILDSQNVELDRRGITQYRAGSSETDSYFYYLTGVETDLNRKQAFNLNDRNLTDRKL